MEEFFRSASSVMTVVSLATFMGILAWTFSSRRTRDFEVAANMPLDEDKTGSAGTAMENEHG